MDVSLWLVEWSTSCWGPGPHLLPEEPPQGCLPSPAPKMGWMHQMEMKEVRDENLYNYFTSSHILRSCTSVLWASLKLVYIKQSIWLDWFCYILSSFIFSFPEHIWEITFHVIIIRSRDINFPSTFNLFSSFQTHNLLLKCKQILSERNTSLISEALQGVISIRQQRKVYLLWTFSFKT